MLFRASEPASLPEDAVEERTKMGVFETQASITAIDPTVCAVQCSCSGQWKHVGTVAEAQESDLGVLRDATSHEVKANLAVVDCTEYKVSKEPWTCAIERMYAYQ